MNDKRFQKKLEKMKKKCERQKAKCELEEQYAEYYPRREGAKVSNVMLVVIVFAISAYTIANFWIAYVSGATIDSTLTTCFYAFWGSELVLLAGIKTSKIVKGTDRECSSCECFDEEETDI